MSVLALEKEKISSIRQEILDAGKIILSFPNATPDNAVFHDARYRLYDIAARTVDRRVAREIHDDPEIQAMTAKVFPVSCEAGVTEECAIAMRLLQEPSLTFGKIYRSYYGEIYETLMMDELAWLSAHAAQGPQRVAYIGGGAMPIPAMLLAQRQGYKVTIIDPHQESCDLARQLIERVGLSHLVDVQVMGGEAADYGAYSMAYVANWIKNKKPIFSQIHQFSNIEFVIARSAAHDSLSFIINDEIDACDLCHGQYDLAHVTTKRLDLSLVSMILRNAPCVPDKAARIAPEPIRRRVVDSMTELIGHTPTLRLDPAKTGLKNIDLYAKLEHMNPFGSIKDRTAWGMIGPHIQDIAARNMRVLELSSGNAARGLQAIASMNGTSLETVSGRIRLAETRKILQLQGAVVTPIDHMIDPMDAYSSLNIVDRIADEERAGYFYTDQYRNPANDGTHYNCTGREILEDIGQVDYMIGSVGTAGSTVGVARRLREANAEMGIVGVLSDETDYIPGIRHKGEVFNVGPYDEKRYDEMIAVSSGDAIDGVLALIRQYGVMAGPSSGATYHAALQYLRVIDETLTDRKSAVFIVCDRVELYLSYIEARRPDIFSA